MTAAVRQNGRITEMVRGCCKVVLCGYLVFPFVSFSSNSVETFRICLRFLLRPSKFAIQNLVSQKHGIRKYKDFKRFFKIYDILYFFRLLVWFLWKQWCFHCYFLLLFDVVRKFVVFLHFLLFFSGPGSCRILALEISTGAWLEFHWSKMGSMAIVWSSVECLTDLCMTDRMTHLWMMILGRVRGPSPWWSQRDLVVIEEESQTWHHGHEQYERTLECYAVTTTGQSW